MQPEITIGVDGGLVLLAESLEERDRAPVELVELLGRVADPLRPVRVRPPRRRLEHDPEPAVAGDPDVWLEVARAAPLRRRRA